MGVNHTANALIVEDIALGAFDAAAVSPVLASKIVIDYLDEAGIIVFWAKGGESLRGVDLGEVDSLGKA